MGMRSGTNPRRMGFLARTVRFLIQDRDVKFGQAITRVVQGSSIEILKTNAT